MRWSYVFCILISSAIIASSNPDESRPKRSLSFLTSLFLHDIRRTQVKCTSASQCKPSKGKQTSAFSDRQKNGVLPVSEKGRDEKQRKQTRTKVPKRAGNNGSSLTNVANDPYQAESQELGATNTIARTTTKNANKERPKIENLSDTKLNSESIATNTQKNFNIDQSVYDTPIIYSYVYGQPNSEAVPTFALDNNSDYIVPENFNQLPMPAYVDDGLGNLIWSVPPYPHQLYPSIASPRYEDSIISPYVLLDHQQGNLGMNMLPNNHMSMYTGKPIIVLEDTSEKIKTPTLFQDCEVNININRKCKQKPRGDIPD